MKVKYQEKIQMLKNIFLLNLQQSIFTTSQFKNFTNTIKICTGAKRSLN